LPEVIFLQKPGGASRPNHKLKPANAMPQKYLSCIFLFSLAACPYNAGWYIKTAEN
jgi:hypothetical protein